MNKYFLIILSFFFSGYIFSCEINYELTDNSKTNISISPDKKVSLKKSDNYVLTLFYEQDHGRCDVKYNDTLFLLEDEKWKITKKNLPLILTDTISWKKVGKREFEGEIKFRAIKKGLFSLEIIRECDRKEGYDEIIQIQVN